jgi:hypothetical protein
MMMIYDIWIMHEDGIMLYQNCTGDMMNADIFGGLMSAINSVSNLIGNASVQGMVIGKKQLSMIKKHGILFIVFHDKHDRPDKVKNKLDDIALRFFSKYPPIMLSTWRGDTGLFSTFKHDIESMFMTFDDAVRKIFQAL